MITIAMLLWAAVVSIILIALGCDVVNHYRWKHSPSPWTRRMIGGAWYCRGGRWTRVPPQVLDDPVEDYEFHPEPVGL